MVYVRNNFLPSLSSLHGSLRLHLTILHVNRPIYITVTVLILTVCRQRVDQQMLLKLQKHDTEKRDGRPHHCNSAVLSNQRTLVEQNGKSVNDKRRPTTRIGSVSPEVIG